MTTSDQPKGLLERLAEGPVICAEGYLFELERRGYLQAGAFGRRKGAELQMIKVKEALPSDVQIRILMSETADGVLHKIWIGPMASVWEEKRIVERIQDRNLGKPVRVIIGSE